MMCNTITKNTHILQIKSYLTVETIFKFVELIYKTHIHRVGKVCVSIIYIPIVTFYFIFILFFWYA